MTDQGIVERAELVDPVVEDFPSFYAREYAAMVSLAASVSGDTTVGEDLAQDAFHRASQRWHQVGTYDKPGAWVRRVVVNLALNRRRRLTREAAALVRLRPPVEVAFPGDRDTEVWKAVAALPAKQRAAVCLFYQEDLTTAEIAEAIGCSESTTRVHLFRARKTLARQLGEELDHDPTDHARPRKDPA